MKSVENLKKRKKYTMSANEKELREARKAERKEKKVAAAAEQEKKDRRYRRNAVIVVVALVVLVIGAYLVNSDVLYTKTTALTVGDTKYSPAEVSYFYRNTYNTVYQNLSDQYGSRVGMLIDNTRPLDEQPYPYDVTGEQTWADVIADTAKQDIIRVTSFADAAAKAGRTLTDEDKATIDATLSSYHQYASVGGFPNVNKFYAAYFGKGVTEDIVAKLQEKIVLGSDYYNEIMDSYQYTDEQLDAYYSEHADEMDYYDFLVFTVYTSMDQFKDLADDAKAEAAHAAAQEIVDAATDPEHFTEAVKAFAGEDTLVNVTSAHADGISINYDDWIVDPARQPGDTAVIDVSTNSYALYFIGRDDNNYNTVDFRHILVQAEADENGNITDEALFFARTKAEDLFAQWRQDPTEENFIALANENSDDTGSNTNGGLYEQVTKYTMVPGVNDFLFNQGHVAGDTGVVLGQSSAYAGYHVMYYVGENANNAHLLAEAAKRAEDFDAKAAELAEGYEAVEGSGMRYVHAF